MKKFNQNVVVGTKVCLNGEWHTVKSIHPTRQWVELNGLVGSFQKSHIEKYSNNKGEKNAK